MTWTRLLSTSRTLLVPLALLGGGCDSSGGGDAEGAFDQAQEAITCGASQSVAIAKGANILADSAGGVIAVAEDVDPSLKISVVSSTKYTCTCNASSGECNPSLEPATQTVSCLPNGCAMEQGGNCTLNQSSAALFDYVKTTLRQKECGVGVPAAAQARAAELDAWITQKKLLPADFSKSGDSAAAPDGYGLVAELVGGLWIVYAVPEDSFDAEGNLKAAVGPVATDTVHQLAAGGGAKCYCDQKGNKKACSFGGGNAGVCAGQCVDIEQQSQCTISLSK